MPDKPEIPRRWWQEDLGCGWIIAVFIICWAAINIVETIVKH
jgi:hypothetical protein